MTRPPPAEPWPYPGDSHDDKLKRIARMYRDKLAEHLPDLCAPLDAALIRLGHGWIRPKPVTYQLDDLLTPEQAADYCGCQLRTLDAWRSRGLRATRTTNGLRYRYDDLLDYHREQRRKRARAPGPD